ncbi:HNH endonuclease [Clostridium estertheticum]|nr:HNH endonuclease [Clostridium estertheticum]WLC90906.1 HNH endonuclease [Clostridium estertheticum]
MFNKHFKTDLTRNQIRSCIKNRKITSNIEKKNLSKFLIKIYTQEQELFIRENVEDKSVRELTTIFNEHFGLEFDVSQLRSYKKNHALKSNLDLRFKKGNIPYSKGKKGTKGWVSTQFKKGNIPYNHLPVGSERINSDDYHVIKIAEPNKWKFKHILVWEKYNGTIPKGYCVIFGDRDRHNLDPNNLIIVSRQQLAILNNNNLIQNNSDLTRTGVIIADIYQRISKRKNV